MTSSFVLPPATPHSLLAGLKCNNLYRLPALTFEDQTENPLILRATVQNSVAANLYTPV